MSVYQVTFSDQAMSELNQLDMMAQLDLVERISAITPDQLRQPREPLGRFHRDDKTFYRLRAGEFRCYFEELDKQTLFAHYILHANSLADFVFRTKMPVSEETLVENEPSFWKYLDSLKKGEGN